MFVKEIYRKHPFTIKDGASIEDAIKLLVELESNGLLVVDAEDHVIGIFSLQDVAAAVVPAEMVENTNLAGALYTEGFFHEQCKKMHGKNVNDIMRKSFLTVTPEDNVMKVAAEFLHNDLYIIPVVVEKKLVGVITRTELKKAFVEGLLGSK